MIERFDFHPNTLQDLQSGPLRLHLESFAALLVQQGYSRQTGRNKLRLVADLDRWLVRQQLNVEALDEQQIGVFLATRWKHVPRRSGDQCTLVLLLRQLRQAGVIPAPMSPVPSPIDLIELDYGHFLLRERALMPASVGAYLPVTRRFLSHQFQDGKVRLNKLSTKDVTDFVLHDIARRGRRSAQLMTTVLRSFLGFLFQRRRITTNLAMAVPVMAGWRLSELPRYLEAEQVEKILRCCDRRCKAGRRDYAILLLLARLGLRAGEVAGLSLDDINWTAGELLVHGKGARVDRLPLLQDVGKAVADYLQKGRPDCSTRRVFVHCKAPYAGFASPPNTVCGIVRRALARAGLHPRHQGAHLLRHSLATRMLRSGASLAQIGQVLRHRQTQTTEIYAKVDLNALRALAQPWIGGVQ